MTSPLLIHRKKATGGLRHEALAHQQMVVTILCPRTSPALHEVPSRLPSRQIEAATDPFTLDLFALYLIIIVT